ncbi:MAG: CRISPR-associated protein [Lachnospiraceae bacterium]|jgi:hypothetical protein|nr:CRISPR-associated protein [Lachnospiraceae bacterium]
MLINLTNHPTCNWNSDQLKAARNRWGSICHISFPEVSPEWNDSEVFRQASAITKTIIAMSPDAVLCQGEMTMTMSMVSLLEKNGIPVYAATSRRQSVESVKADGTIEKQSVFQFVRFRRYQLFAN